MEVCKISLSIGKYQGDEIICDVIEMDDCHILWGQSWYYNIDVTYICWDNRYLFRWYYKKIILVSCDEQFVSAGVNKEKDP